MCKADSASFNQPGTKGVSCTETLGNTVIYMQYLCDYAQAAVAMTAAAAQVQVRLTGLLTSSFFIALQKPALSQACAWSISVRPCRQHEVRQSHTGPMGVLRMAIGHGNQKHCQLSACSAQRSRLCVRSAFPTSSISRLMH